MEEPSAVEPHEVIPDPPAVTPLAAPSFPNYHIELWPTPAGPPLYLCLVADCGYKDATEAEILAHVPAVHGVAAVPTPLAADPSMIASLAFTTTEHEATGTASPPAEEGPRT